MNFIKIETTNFDQAYVNPSQVAAITKRQLGGTRIALLNGDYIETPWTCTKALAAITQTVYDPSADPEAESDDSLAGQVKKAMLALKEKEHAISCGSKIFNNRVSLNDVIVPLTEEFAAVINISDYISLSGESRGIDLKIGPAKSPFGARVAARYGIPALSDKDLEIGPELIRSYFDPALVELLIAQLNKWVAALV